MGLIARTAAEGASLYELQWDLPEGLKETIEYYEKAYSELY